MSKLKKLFNDWSTKGVKLPYGYDPVTKQPSITILFPYITFVIACISVILLHIFEGMLVAAATSIFFWASAVIFYLLRKLEKASIDFNNRKISLDSGDNCETKNKK